MSADQGPPMPQPTAEHTDLLKMVGKWNIHCKFFMEPGQPPMETEAKETVEAVGPFWITCKFESNFMGAPFSGRASVGYEPHTKRYVSTWIDSMAPVFFHLTGEKRGNSIEMKGNAFSCMVNAVIPHRTVERHLSVNEHIFDMYCTPPGSPEIHMMSNHYKRA